MKRILWLWCVVAALCAVPSYFPLLKAAYGQKTTGAGKKSVITTPTAAPAVVTVTPQYVQPGGEVTLTFKPEVQPTSVKVGKQEAELLEVVNGKVGTLRVRLSPSTPANRQNVEVSATSAVASQVVWVMPMVLGIQDEVEALGGMEVPAQAQPNARDNTSVPDNRVVAGRTARILLSDNFPIYKTAAVNIGTFSLAAAAAGKSLLFTVPPEITPGNHRVTVTADGQNWMMQPVARVFPAPVQASITNITPRLVRPKTYLTINGRNLNAPPDKVAVLVGGVNARIIDVGPQGDSITAEVNEDGPDGQKLDPSQPLQVRLWDVAVPLPETMQVKTERAPTPQQTLSLVGIAAGIMASIAGLIYWLHSYTRERRSWFAVLLLEPANNTYSLSRAQFFWWLSIIAFAYIFLFLGHGFVQENWSFPSLAGFGITFMISLATLLTAQATSSVKGVKGAGSVHPAPSDLIMHGGVLAPERVQQVVWSVIAGVGFLAILIKTYHIRGEIPAIPEELLYLMGISSAGYLGGKLTRRGGPVINQVTVASGSVKITIRGDQLSANAMVWLDNAPLPQEAISPQGGNFNSTDFVDTLLVTLPASSGINNLDEWFGTRRTVTVVNEDRQRAEWWTAPAIVDLKVEEKKDDEGNEILSFSITGEHIDANARWEIPGASLKEATQVPGMLRNWVVVFTKPATTSYGPVKVTNPDDRFTEFPPGATLTPTIPIPQQITNPETTNAVQSPLGTVEPAPPVNTPPVNTPPVNTPPVNTPPVNTPPADLESEEDRIARMASQDNS